MAAQHFVVVHLDFFLFVSSALRVTCILSQIEGQYFLGIVGLSGFGSLEQGRAERFF